MIFFAVNEIKLDDYKYAHSDIALEKRNTICIVTI